MYQGKTLKGFYQIRDNYYLLEYTNGLKEVLTFNSFYIKVGKLKYDINKLIRLKNILFKNENKFALDFKNLSTKKMNYYETLNKDGFKQDSFKYQFNEENDNIGLSFNLKSKDEEIKVILLLNNKKARVLPIITANNKISVIENSKTYKIIKKFLETPKSQLNPKFSKNFFNMIKYSEYLNQNSYYQFQLSEKEILRGER